MREIAEVLDVRVHAAAHVRRLRQEELHIEQRECRTVRFLECANEVLDWRCGLRAGAQRLKIVLGIEHRLSERQVWAHKGCHKAGKELTAISIGSQLETGVLFRPKKRVDRASLAPAMPDEVMKRVRSSCRHVRPGTEVISSRKERVRIDRGERCIAEIIEDRLAVQVRRLRADEPQIE